MSLTPATLRPAMSSTLRTMRMRSLPCASTSPSRVQTLVVPGVRYSHHKRELQTATPFTPHRLPGHMQLGNDLWGLTGGLPFNSQQASMSKPLAEWEERVTRDSREAKDREEKAQQTNGQEKSSASTSATTQKEPQQAQTQQKQQRPRRKLKARKAAISLTPMAVSHLRDLSASGSLVRIGVKNRGCSGLAYHLDFVEKAGAFDEIVEQDGVKVLIDSKALFSIIGSVMDWEDTRLSSKFIFKNPNIKHECGCGESFAV
ncbi:Iron-sulfur assembly protein 1 [Ascosphaera atra]|nr:Iron-sulfur assembly protein 1 [Ascosphaera atra]